MKTKLLMVMALSMTFATAYANQDQVLNSDPIDVDGYLQERQVTDGELEQIRGEIRKQKGEVILNKEKSKGFKELSKTTEKLSETTEEYLGDKKDAQKEIAEYNAKIKCLMEEHPGKDCDKYIKARREEEDKPVVQEVVVAQAAPAYVSVAEVAPSHGDLSNPFEEIKLIPLAGATTYNGDRESLEASMTAGLRLESNINSRLSMGMGFNYSTLKTDDFGGNIYSNTGYGGGYYGNQGYGMQGREIQFKTMGIDLYGKFFITRGERFRPYIGAGIGYNQATMNYSQNNPYSYDVYSFGNENYKQSYATGKVMAGTEIMITRSIGLTFEANYTTGFGSGSSQDSRNLATSPDQARLRSLGKDIVNSNAMAILGGLVVTF